MYQHFHLIIKNHYVFINRNNSEHDHKDKYSINHENPNSNNFEEIKIKQIKKEKEKISNMNNFKLGISNNTNFIEKIEFNSDLEYYSYYLGIECINIDKLIIIKMVKDYIITIQWCINYYLKDCKSWSWGYTYMISPLIKDIIKLYDYTRCLSTACCASLYNYNCIIV